MNKYHTYQRHRHTCECHAYMGVVVGVDVGALVGVAVY